MMSDRTAPFTPKPERSALLDQGRHACPDPKRAGLSRKDPTKERDRLKPATGSACHW